VRRILPRPDMYLGGTSRVPGGGICVLGLPFWRGDGENAFFWPIASRDKFPSVYFGFPMGKKGPFRRGFLIWIMET